MSRFIRQLPDEASRSSSKGSFIIRTLYSGQSAISLPPRSAGGIDDLFNVYYHYGLVAEERVS